MKRFNCDEEAMTQHPNGEYVSYEDYWLLENENKALREQLKRPTVIINSVEALSAFMAFFMHERVRHYQDIKYMDKMVDRLANMGVHPPKESDKLMDVWFDLEV